MSKYASVKEDDKAYVLHSWSKQGPFQPKVMTQAEGVYFWDDSGKRYIDMSSQLVYANIGHQHPKLLKALTNIDLFSLAGPSFATKPKSILSKKIIELAPSNMAKVFYTSGGAEANDHAIKIARMYSGRYKIFSRYRSYHGATFGAGNLTGESRRFPAEPGLPGFVKFEVPYMYREVIDFASDEEATAYYLGKLRNQILYEGAYSIAAIFLEPIPGSNGVLIPPKGYLEGVRALCDEFGILLICDEVMTGFGRTGTAFSVDHYNFNPDIITFAKGVTAGYAPLGGVIVSESIASYFDNEVLMTGLTYSGHALCTEIGVATLNVYEEENIFAHVQSLAPVLQQRLQKLLSFACVGEVRSIGLFAGVEIVKDKQSKEPIIEYGLDYGKDTVGLMAKLVGMLLANGFYTYSHESTVIIAPPLVITESELHEAMDIFEQTLLAFEEEVLLPVQEVL
ncbi:MAG: aminotransferase class III-fold pyridoxal phosphate-dependent enzyme [Lysinibacillus sp.]